MLKSVKVAFVLSLPLVMFAAGCIGQTRWITPVPENHSNGSEALPPACYPSWSCSAWGNCSAGENQRRTCADLYSCGTNEGKPAEIQVCTLSNEQKYLLNAKVSDLSGMSCGMEVNVTRYGYYTYAKQWEGNITAFRIDVTVKNMGLTRSEQDFNVNANNAWLRYGWEIYEYSPDGTLTSGAVPSGMVKRGYLLYKGVPNNIGGNVTAAVGWSDFYSTQISSSCIHEFVLQL